MRMSVLAFLVSLALGLKGGPGALFALAVLIDAFIICPFAFPPGGAEARLIPSKSGPQGRRGLKPGKGR